MTKLFRISLLFVFIFSGITSYSCLQAQASLSIQGILKKSNGLAVDDGSYTIKFKLYKTSPSNELVWEETQTDVEVFNGIYSTELGKINALTPSFDQLYELGVTIGNTELSPRILLTSAPYALSLIGQTNQFPSSGQVLADSIIVNGGVIARGGAPGLNGVNGNGYAFQGNSGDNDSGLFSTGDGKASIYSNNTEVLAVTPGAVTVAGNLTNTGTFTTGNVNLSPGGTVNYNGQNDWRLVETDYFENNSEGWNVYIPITPELIGWNNGTSTAISPSNFGGQSGFAGQVLMPSNNNDVLKKQFTIPGSFTYIKVKFKYHFLNSWDDRPEDMAFAGFASSATGSNLRIAWNTTKSFMNLANGKFNTTDFKTVTDYISSDNTYIDQSMDVEMTGKAISGNSFWVFIGAGLDNGTVNENYAIGFVEVWVK